MDDLTDFQLAMSRLDESVTGKSKRTTEHTARNQPKTVEAWYLSSERAWYLSDGGYSRISCEDNGRLFLTSNSLDGAKERWTDSVFWRRRVELQILAWLSKIKQSEAPKEKNNEHYMGK
jgi:hypothetical protein